MEYKRRFEIYGDSDSPLHSIHTEGTGWWHCQIEWEEYPCHSLNLGLEEEQIQKVFDTNICGDQTFQLNWSEVEGPTFHVMPHHWHFFLKENFCPSQIKNFFSPYTSDKHHRMSFLRFLRLSGCPVSTKGIFLSKNPPSPLLASFIHPAISLY